MRARARQTAVAAAALALTAAVAGFADTRSTVEGWSLGTAYSAFILLAVSMVLGPLNVLRGKHNPVHSAVRRDVGIAAGLAGLVHTALGLQVHMGGALAQYFTFKSDASPARMVFVAANYVGLVSALLLAALVAISNNPGVRAFGLARWKKLQRMAYIAAGAALLHGIIYQLLEKRNPAMIALVLSIAVAVIVLQTKGLSARRKSALTDSEPGDAHRR